MGLEAFFWMLTSQFFILLFHPQKETLVPLHFLPLDEAQGIFKVVELFYVML